MCASRVCETVGQRKEASMNGTVMWSIVAIVFVLATLAIVGFALFELSPFARHADVYHGREHQQSPHLE
jgi:hypothetical protein